jgi:hypothetical protein
MHRDKCSRDREPGTGLEVCFSVFLKDITWILGSAKCAYLTLMVMHWDHFRSTQCKKLGLHLPEARNGLVWRPENFFCKGTDNKYFISFRPYWLYGDYSTLPCSKKKKKSRHRKYVKGYVWLCLNKTLFT